MDLCLLTQDYNREIMAIMEQPTNLHKRLNEIQQTLKAPKGQRNAFGNYNYRSCEDILEAVKPLLGDLILTIGDEIVQHGDRYYVKATAILSDGTSAITNSAYARESQDKKGMDDSQITGSTSSYARKYALNGLLAIDDTKDADTMDNTKEAEKVFGAKAVDSKENFGTCEKCGAPMAKSKSTGNFYCSEFCWKKPKTPYESNEITKEDIPF